MSSRKTGKSRDGSIKQVIDTLEADSSHHLADPFLPQTPIGTSTPPTSGSPTRRREGSKASIDAKSKGLWSDLKTLRWMREPASSFKMLLVPIVLYLNWSFINLHETNPFAPFLFISYPLSGFPPDDPRYGKGLLDAVFTGYYIIVFSFLRQFLTLKVIDPIARRLGIKKQAKLDRFGEQAYALLYYGAMGIWGIYIMSKLPTWWYKSENFWIGYPHWEMIPLLKRYYLMHLAYWCQQLIVIAVKLEKPRKDYNGLVVHHLVTVYLISWSYGINYTMMGNAVFVSMDIPDAFLAFSKLCNYLELIKTKAVAFITFICAWTYFRHWLNLVMLWSVWFESDLAPEASKTLRPADGLWMPWWMKYQIFLPMLTLQALNIFWYFLIWRIAIRAVTGAEELDDDRSDDEGDDHDDHEE